MIPDLVHLRSFTQVVERGTVAAAAAATGFTPPALSQHLAKLERSLDVQLFERVGGRLRPTPAAVALLPHALEMLDLAERCRGVARPVERPVTTVVAGLASVLAELLAPVLRRLGPRPGLSIVDAEDADALRELGLGHVDVALVQEYDGVASAGPDRRFTYQPVARDDLRLVLPPHLPATTTLASLDGAPWLVQGPGTRCAAAVAAVLAREGVRPVVAGRIDDNHALLALVAAGHGASIVPALVLDHAGGGVTVADERLGASRTIVAVTRRASTSDHQPLVDDLIRYDRERWAGSA